MADLPSAKAKRLLAITCSLVILWDPITPFWYNAPSMRIVAMTAVALLAACGTNGYFGRGSAVARSVRSVAPPEVVEEHPLVADLPERQRLRLRLWMGARLAGANLVSTLQMERQTLRSIALLRRKTGEESVSELEMESVRLELIQEHGDIARLPADKEAEFVTWRTRVLGGADRSSVGPLRKTVSRRIAFLETRLGELKNRHLDLVWDSWLKWQLLLRFEEFKLRAIDRGR